MIHGPVQSSVVIIWRALWVATVYPGMTTSLNNGRISKCWAGSHSNWKGPIVDPLSIRHETWSHNETQQVVVSFRLLSHSQCQLSSLLSSFVQPIEWIMIFSLLAVVLNRLCAGGRTDGTRIQGLRSVSSVYFLACLLLSLSLSRSSGCCCRFSCYWKTTNSSFVSSKAKRRSSILWRGKVKEIRWSWAIWLSNETRINFVLMRFIGILL